MCARVASHRVSQGGASPGSSLRSAADPPKMEDRGHRLSGEGPGHLFTKVLIEAPITREAVVDADGGREEADYMVDGYSLGLNTTV
jgi:hypothetical protein